MRNLPDHARKIKFLLFLFSSPLSLSSSPSSLSLSLSLSLSPSLSLPFCLITCLIISIGRLWQERTILVKPDKDNGYGFSLSGERPVFIDKVIVDGPSYQVRYETRRCGHWVEGVVIGIGGQGCGHGIGGCVWDMRCGQGVGGCGHEDVIRECIYKW